MPDHNDAPSEHLPNGAVFPDTPAEQPSPATMIGDDQVVLDASEVQATVHEIEEVSQPTLGEGAPLPVGANEPDGEAIDDGTRPEPPGMPHQPDDLDREMAAAADARWSDERLRNATPATIWPMDATVPQANNRQVITVGGARTVRGALLRHIAESAHAQRRAVGDYADALRQVQESRDAYVAARETRVGAIDALFALGLDVADDHEDVTPTVESERIPDSMIV